MTLTEPQLKDIILKNPNKNLVTKGQEMNKRLRMHMYGDGLDTHLQIIDTYEGKKHHELRKKYAKSNKSLFSRLSRPLDKVFSAKGGSTYFNLSEAQDKQAMQLVSNVRDGYSSKKWLEHFWKPHFLDDPYGLIFMEIGNGVSIPAGKAYPTYKSIHTVYDYLPVGSNLEYIVFNVSKSQKVSAGLKEDDVVFRVVDDAFDYYVKRVNDDVEILRNLTFVNFFYRVPAMVNSDMVDPQIENGFISLFDATLEDADQFLLKGSIRVVHEFKHGFPKYWEYGDDCSECGGTGLSDGGKNCDACKGGGKQTVSKPSQVKVLTYPDKETPIVTPDPGGYIEPSKTYHDIVTEDLSELESVMTYTVWGVHSKQKTQGMSAGKEGDTKTATQIMDEIQPMAAQLTKVSDSASIRAKFINDLVIMIGLKKPNYAGSSVTMGKRYGLESADVIWERYIKAKKDKAPVVVLNDLLVEYIGAQYDDDPVGYEIAKKLMYIEPFVHQTVQEVKGMDAGDSDYIRKLFFSEWLAQMNDSDLLSLSDKELKALLDVYVADKELKEVEAAPPQ